MLSQRCKAQGGVEQVADGGQYLAGGMQSVVCSMWQGAGGRRHIVARMMTSGDIQSESNIEHGHYDMIS